MSTEPSTPLNDADHAGSFDFYKKLYICKDCINLKIIIEDKAKFLIRKNRK